MPTKGDPGPESSCKFQSDTGSYTFFTQLFLMKFPFALTKTMSRI